MSNVQAYQDLKKSTYPLQQEYKLSPGKSQVTITLISKGASFSETKEKKILNYGEIGIEKPSEDFTVYSKGEYVYALIETQYNPTDVSPPTKPPTVINPPSSCHIYFKPEGSNWLWSTDAQTADNVSIFPSGQGERTKNEVNIQLPTSQNPASKPSTYPNLNSELVFLLDKNDIGNMLFRGNEPLEPGKHGQKIDFETLHTSLKSKYQRQTGMHDFPEIGKYILRDIAFLGHNPDGEKPILMHEISSFGATEISQVNQTWYPTKAVAISPTGMLGQVSNWNVEPTGSGNIDLDVTMVKKLVEWMGEQQLDSKGKKIPTIYYIHCSSGHDRTGMISSGYLMHQYNLALSEAYILGTTIHKLDMNYGGNLITDCEDITSKAIDPDRSRCFVAGNGTSSPYNDAIVDIYNSLNSVKTGKLSATAISGDPAISNSGTTYVHSWYPWSK